MTKTLTIRGVTPEMAARLEALGRERGHSVNSVVLHLLRLALGVDEREERLRRYATWTEADAAEFDDALARQRVVDDALWR